MTCVPNKDTYQPGHPPSLIRGFTVRMKKHWVLGYPLSAQGRMIRLGRCPGWFESSLGAPIILLVLSCSISIIEPRHDKTNKMSARPVKTQISLGIRPDWSVFAVRMKKAWVLSYPMSAERRLIRLGGCPGWSESSMTTRQNSSIKITGVGVYGMCK